MTDNANRRENGRDHSRDNGYRHPDTILLEAMEQVLAGSRRPTPEEIIGSAGERPAKSATR